MCAVYIGIRMIDDLVIIGVVNIEFRSYSGAQRMMTGESLSLP